METCNGLTSCPQTTPTTVPARFRQCRVQLHRDQQCDARVRQLSILKCFSSPSSSPSASASSSSPIPARSPSRQPPPACITSSTPYSLDRRTREITASLAASHEFNVSFTYPAGYTPRSILVSSMDTAGTSRNKSVTFSAQNNQVYHFDVKNSRGSSDDGSSREVSTTGNAGGDDDSEGSDQIAGETEPSRAAESCNGGQQITVRFSASPRLRSPSPPARQESDVEEIFHIDLDDDDDDEDDDEGDGDSNNGVVDLTESDAEMPINGDPLDDRRSSNGQPHPVKPKRGRPLGSLKKVNGSASKTSTTKKRMGRPPKSATSLPPKSNKIGRPSLNAAAPKKEKTLIHLKFNQLLRSDQRNNGKRLAQRYGAKFFHARVLLSVLRNVDDLLQQNVNEVAQMLTESGCRPVKTEQE